MSQNNVEGFRLSPQQRYLWSLQQAAGSSAYQVVSTVSIHGELRTEILQRALTDVVGRHEILRTTFQRPPGIKTPFQVISETAHFSWQFSDLSNLDQEALVNKLENSFAAERGKPFDFERGPLLRTSLYRLSREYHMLLISLPALCGDSITVLNLITELGRAYESILHGEAFPEEPMQYADFAEWHNELLDGSDEQAEEGRNYGQELMARQVSPLSLPLEKRRTEGQTFQPEAVSIDFDSTCVANVETLAREYETLTQVVLFAFWQALVWRLTNRSEFLIFNLSDGRKLADLQGALGLYAKYLPVACRCEDVSFATHLQVARAALNDAEEWQEYFDPNNFSEAARDAVAFDFIEQDSVIENAGLKLSLARQEAHLSPFKLKISCFRLAGSIRAELFYDPHSFDRETIERYAAYFRRLVAQTSSTALTLGKIDILSEAERQRLLVDINQTASEFSEGKCIHELFEEQAARTPEATALVCGDLELTYAELNALANRLAHLLRRRGLVPNARVGICIERSAETIVALLGILKAGGSYVPLNPQHPAARLALQLAESNASFLITKAAAQDDSLDFGGEIIDLDRDRALLLAEPDINPPVNSLAGLAYVIYTSGSTGVPKGVAVGHRGLVNYTQFILRRLHVKEPLHFATVSTITADLGNTCIFPALISGGCLHLISYDVAMEGALFSEYVAKHPIDILKIVPSHFSALLAAAPHGDVLPKEYLILGGEALSWELVDRISQTNHTCEIINHYGPTETTVGSLTFDVKPNEVSTHSLTVPIGQPIANTRVYILDRHFNLMPVGVAGELYIGGAGLAAGYLNQPVETAARFVPNPFSDEPGARLYRTGDLARYLPDANIEFLGRMDHQVKVRGFRVELGEIEAVLLMHSEVRQAVVIAEPGTTENQRLLGYVVASGIKPPGVDELRAFLGQHLPDYMIPATFVFLKTLPLTANGKIDRAALPAPDEARPDLQRLFVAPRTSVEKELAGIWTEFLKLNEVGVHDNFFELGGHSLLATQVVSRMRKIFNCEMSLRSLFESPTIAQLAQHIGGSTATDTERLLAEIEKLSDEEVEMMLKAEQL
jgi:amino acid adenylation domain-containing protein